MTTYARRRRRLALLAASAVAAATLQAAFASPAEAGQVGVTLSIQGAGSVTVVEGSLEDGGAGSCTTYDNLDDRVTVTCPRVRNSEVFEAWVWLRAKPAPSPEGQWAFAGWSGCDELRERDGSTECGVHSGAFSSDERTPKARFRDVVAPTVTTASAQQVIATNRSYRFTFAADEGVTQCRLVSTDTGFGPCTSPYDRTVQWGSDRLQIRAVDESGNVGAVREVDVVGVDTLLFPDVPVQSRSRTATFSYQGVEGGDFMCSLDYAAYTSCGTGETASVTYTGLADAQHVFRVYARHGLVMDHQPSTHEWRVDTVAPTTSLTPTVDGRSAAFTFTAAGAAQHECRLVGPGTPATWGRCLSPLTLEGLVDGEYTLEVRASDLAGNVESPPASHTWTVDGVAPETSTDGPTGFVLATSAKVGLRSTESGGTFACTLDGRARACGPTGLALTGLSRGTHVVTAAATDALGNTDATPATRTWTVPLAAADLRKARGWKRTRSSAAYGGTYLQATRKGATLTRAVRGARSVALVVGRCRQCGNVKVYAGSRLLRTVRLSGPAATKQLTTVAGFSQPFTGSLRIVVATEDRPVRIEGLGVATR